MITREIKVTDYAGEIIEKLPKGVLLTTKAGEQVDSMIIGWGSIGVNWGVPTFTCYIRQSRYTKEMLEKNPEFTVNVPAGKIDPKIFKVCSTTSGRDTDKVQEAGLTLVEKEGFSVPGIRELPITLQCRVSYTQDQDLSTMSDALVERWYPESAQGRNPHTTVFAQIVGAYVIED